MLFSRRSAVVSPFGVRVFALGVGLFVGLAMARPAAPLISRDGAVTVRAQMEQSGYRAPILVFVDRTRESLQRTVRVELGSASVPLEIVVGGQKDGDTRVVASRVRGSDGAVRERIELPDPEAADLAQFTRAICVALLRTWITETAGRQGQAAAQEIPVWLIGGLVRYMDRGTRQTDVDRTLLLWSHACLPPASELVASDSWAAMREPAVAATLLAWLLDRRRPSGSAFEALLRELAAGNAWRASRVASAVVGREDERALDEALDRWLLDEGRQVVQPGVTTDGVVRRFRSHLLLYPADCDKTLNTGRAWLTFEEAVERADDLAVRHWAAFHSNAVRLAAVGRDGMLLAVSDAYALFLESFARGKKKDELLRLLREAEAKRSELERKAAQGDLLQDPATR